MLKRRDPNVVGTRTIPEGKEARMVIILGSVLVTAFLALWLGRMSHLENPFAAYLETGESGEYYKYRQLVEEDVIGKARQGTWSAKKVAINGGPFVMVLLGYLFYRTRNFLYLALIAIQSFFGIMVAGVLAHKSYLLITVFSPLLGVLIWRLQKFSAKAVLPVLGILFFAGGTMIFYAAINTTIEVAFIEFLTRVFLIPAYVPLYFYEAVPDALPFRGVIETLYIYHTRAPVGDYAIYDVAYHATGRAYGANAHFLAVAYTGLGFLGVFGVAVLCLGLILLMDYFLVELKEDHRVVAVFFSVFGFIGITSINFLGALENGFLIGSLVFFLVCRGRTTSSQDQVTYYAPSFGEPGPATR
jgi:hypothetical protein